MNTIDIKDPLMKDLFKQGILLGKEKAQKEANEKAQRKLEQLMSEYLDKTLIKLRQDLVAKFGECIEVVSEEITDQYCSINGTKKALKIVRVYPTVETIVSREEIR